jgi:hypothetical protein
MYRLYPVLLLALIMVCIVQCGSYNNQSIESPFRKDNLMAWCIVPFDAENRGPFERAAMMKSLGITRFAYDWRTEHIPTFDQEIDALQQQGIRLDAFWLPCKLPDPLQSENVQLVLKLLARRNVKTQLWITLNMQAYDELAQDEKVAMAAQAVEGIAREADKIGCTVGLYNHGGWFGEPENQIAIIQATSADNVGIVYNFHHGHEHVANFSELLNKMLPYLYAVNINGMRQDTKILPLGAGDDELEMLRILKDSSYRGLVGILGHIKEQDAQISLQNNLTGLQNLLRTIGDHAALQTYE